MTRAATAERTAPPTGPITSLEELEAVPIGQFVRLQNNAEQTWERTPSGYSKNGNGVPLSAFIGAIDQGYVARFNAHLSPGDCFHVTNYSRRQFVVVDQRDGVWDVVHLREGAFYSFDRMNATSILSHVRTEPIPGIDTICSMARHQVMVDDESRRLTAGQVADLHEYAAKVDDTTFDDLLHTIGYGRGADHVSTVTIRGTSTMAPDKKQTQSLLGEGFRVRQVQNEIQVAWTKTVPLTNYGIGCTCSKVTQEQVDLYLPPGTTSHQWTVEH